MTIWERESLIHCFRQRVEMLREAHEGWRRFSGNRPRVDRVVGRRSALSDSSPFSASRPSLTRHGFCWRVLYFTTAEHPAGERYGGYYKHIRAWTPWGARRFARSLRHQKWDVEIVGRA